MPQRRIDVFWDDAPMLDEPRDALYLLQRWYVAQCDSEWEHTYGISIETLDNPGWHLRIELTGAVVAALGDRDWTKLERSEHDRVHWRVANASYEAACGPTNLGEAIIAFLDLAGARLDV